MFADFVFQPVKLLAVDGPSMLAETLALLFYLHRRLWQAYLFLVVHAIGRLVVAEAVVLASGQGLLGDPRLLVDL